MGPTSSSYSAQSVSNRRLTVSCLDKFNAARAAFGRGSYGQAVECAADLVEAVADLTEIRDQRRATECSCSIIVVSYRPTKQLSEQFDKLHNYRVSPKFELIFVDNGNPDLAKRAVNVGPSLYLKPPFNFGCSGARDLGLRWARGKWVVFIEDDGLLADQAIEALIETAESYAAIAVRGRSRRCRVA